MAKTRWTLEDIPKHCHRAFSISFQRRKRNYRHVSTFHRFRSGVRLAYKMVQYIRSLFVLFGVVVFVQVFIVYAQSSEFFALNEVVISPHLKAYKKQIMSYSGLSLGMNLLNVSLKDVAKRLMHVPQFESVGIARQFPRSISLSIKLKQAIGVVKLESYYFVDKRGIPFAKVATLEPYARLVKLSGYSPTQYVDDPVNTRNLLLQALAIKKKYTQLRLGRFLPIHEIRYDPVFGHTLCSGPSQIHLGTNRYGLRLRYLKKLYDYLSKRGIRDVDYIYLNHERHTQRAVVHLHNAVPIAEK